MAMNDSASAGDGDQLTNDEVRAPLTPQRRNTPPPSQRQRVLRSKEEEEEGDGTARPVLISAAAFEARQQARQGHIIAGGIVALIVACAAAVLYTPAERLPVRLHIQRAYDSSFNLPEGESPETMVKFLNHHSKRLSYRLDSSGDLAVSHLYVAIASSNRLDEMLLDKTQVSTVGTVDAFLFVWITSRPNCVEGGIVEDHRTYIKEKLGPRVEAGFICWWDGFIEADLTLQSIQHLDNTLLSVADARSGT